MDKFAFNMALEEIWIVVRRANKYIDEKAPWILAKDPDKKAELDTVMRNLAEAIRIVTVLIEPFMHSTSKEIRKQLGMSVLEAAWEEAFTFDAIGGAHVQKGRVLFPRLDIDKELEELAAIKAAQEPAGGKEENHPLELKP